MKKITFEISKEGQVKIDTEGYRGPECLEATRPFESLGAVASDEPKAELYSAEKDTLKEGW